MLNVKDPPRPNCLMQLWSPGSREHSTATSTLGIVQHGLEKICVLSVSEYKLKSDCPCESVFKCYSEVIICVIHV